MTDTFCRHFRIAADVPELDGADDGIFASVSAENRLRDRLRAGEIPDDFALVAPERGVISDIDNEGRFRSPMCCWANPQSQPRMAPCYTAAYLAGGIYVFADVDVTNCEPDGTNWASGGSVLVTEGRITQLAIPHWLSPYADPLADAYGVEVVLLGQPVPDYQVEEMPPVIRNVLSPFECEYLRKSHDANCRPMAEVYGEKGFTVQVGSANEATCKEGLRECGRIDVAPLPWDTFGDPTNPRRYGDLIDTKNRFAGWKFGMPTNRYVPGPVSKRYWPGASMPEHTDRNPGPDPVSYSRTTSMSVLLSEPGEDFTGGEFLTPYGPVEAHLGDAIIFTAATRHQITPVESGERFVILAIGAWDGFNP